MDDELERWQTRLEKHFAELRILRQRAGLDRPVFALEHGLKPAETEALANTVRADIANGAPSRQYELPWTVYAAEIGYRYSGSEYWQTFEEETPGWLDRGDRYWIRECYKSFQRDYGGARPCGAWAQQFSIICWPITHAVLPRDLQRQLARILYELRHSFSADLLESPPTLGQFIAARSWNANSRFQNLAQEPQLVGQIAAALLLEGGHGSSNLIHPWTLERIGHDLDHERRAREWLRGARRFARERAQIRGLALGSGTTPAALTRPEEARATLAALGIEPRLMLRPTDTEGKSWQVFLEIPDLSHLLFKFPNFRDILMGSRCTVAGALGRPLARGRCLHGPQRIALARWPRADEVLLQFETRDSQLEYLLRTECLLRPGPKWLFRITSDGCAYESRGLRVRPGKRYIIVTTGSSAKPSDWVRPVSLPCEGVHSAAIDVPPAVTREWEDVLRSLGLGQAKTIEVWPAGLGAVVWDGEGHGEWLASERPCLAIRTDHPIAALFVGMETDTDSALELTSVVPGKPVFVELPQLPVGVHGVHVSIRGSSSSEVESLGTLDVVMRIREARRWSPGLSPNGPLLVQMEPAAPTLEQIWEGRVDVTLLGPLGRQVTCSVSLHETDGNAALFAKTLPPIQLPVTPPQWHRHLGKYFQETREAQASYDTARVCNLAFRAEELGAFTVRCERDFTPLRWAVRRSGRAHVARLLDDGGTLDPPSVGRLEFETPCVEQRLEFSDSYQVPRNGGLYVARRGDFTAGVIIPPSVRGLSDLRCVPTIEGQTRSTNSALKTLTIAALWGQAKLSGDLFSAIRQRDVLLALSAHIIGILGGENWARAENVVGRGSAELAFLQSAISRRHGEAQIGEELMRQHSELALASTEERIRVLAALAARHLKVVSGGAGPDNGEWLSELALRISSDPSEVAGWAGNHLGGGVTRLLEELPTLARAARFLVLATDRVSQSHASIRGLYSGWGWK